VLALTSGILVLTVLAAFSPTFSTTFSTNFSPLSTILSVLSRLIFLVTSVSGGTFVGISGAFLRLKISTSGPELDFDLLLTTAVAATGL
jgi:hypothetical protein